MSKPFNKQLYVTVQNFYVHVYNTGLSFQSATQVKRKCSTRAVPSKGPYTHLTGCK